MSTNINEFYGNVNNSQIQQNTNNSSQSLSANEDYDKKEELMRYILLLKENIDNIGLEQVHIKTLLKSVENVEIELRKEKAKPKVVKECLGTVRNVLEEVAGSLIASGLIYQLNNFI